MEIDSLSIEDFDRWNDAAEDYLSEYHIINRLPPGKQHQRINANEIFRDYIVICDVFLNNRVLHHDTL